MSDNRIHFDHILCRLTIAERDLFQRYCVQGESLTQLASTIPCLPETVRQYTCMLRTRLQTLLSEAGFSRAEARDYLYQTLTMHRDSLET